MDAVYALHARCRFATTLRAFIAFVCLFAYGSQLRAEGVLEVPMLDVGTSCANVKGMIGFQLDTQFNEFVRTQYFWGREGYRKGYKDLIDTLLKRAEEDLSKTCKGQVGNCTPQLVAESVARTITTSQAEIYQKGKFFTPGFAISFGMFAGATVLQTLMTTHPFLQLIHISSAALPYVQSLVQAISNVALTAASFSFSSSFRSRMEENINSVANKLTGGDVGIAQQTVAKLQVEEIWLADKVAINVADTLPATVPTATLIHQANGYVIGVTPALLTIGQSYLPRNQIATAARILGGQAIAGKPIFDSMAPTMQATFWQAISDVLEPLMTETTPQQAQALFDQTTLYLTNMTISPDHPNAGQPRYASSDIEGYFKPWLRKVLLDQQQPGDLADMRKELLAAALAIPSAAASGP